MSHETYEVFALRYGERPERTRRENFLEPVDAHDTPMPIDYFVWVVRNANRTLVIDTGFDRAEAARRDRRVDAVAVRGALEHRHRGDERRGRGRHPPALRPRRDAGGFPARAVPHPGDRDAVRDRTLDARRRRAPRLLRGPRHGARAPSVREAGSSSTTRTARSRPASPCTACPGTRWACSRSGCPPGAGGSFSASDASHYYEHWVRRVPFAICWSRDDLLAS